MRERKFHKKIPLASWLLILVALGSLGTGTVAAYLSYATKPVTNTFQVAQSVLPDVKETFDKTVKTNVSVNVGDTSFNNDAGYSVYVRAAVVATWKDPDGNVLGKVPVKGTDYTIVYPDSYNSNWFEHGGFYYHKAPVGSKGSTKILISSCKLEDGVTAPAGYSLNVEILTQTIQALGETDADNTPAVTDAWGVTVNNDGTLAPPTT